MNGFFGVLGINTGSWYFKPPQISLAVVNCGIYPKMPIDTVLFPTLIGTKLGEKILNRSKYGITQLRLYLIKAYTIKAYTCF